MPHTLQTLATYPIKGVRALYPVTARLERLGLEHDRRWAVLGTDNKALTQRTHPALAVICVHPIPGGLHLSAAGHGTMEATPSGPPVTLTVWGTPVPAIAANQAASAWLSAVLGTPCTLAHQSSPTSRAVTPDLAEPGDTVSLADGFPLLVTGTASLAALATALPAIPGPVPMDRFRPNLVIETTEPWEEDTWSHIDIAAGPHPIRLRLASPCVRCAVVTIDQQTAEPTPRKEPLRTLGLIHRTPEGHTTFGWNAVPESLGTLQIGAKVTPILRP